MKYTERSIYLRQFILLFFTFVILSPFSAWADNYFVKVGGTQVTSGNAEDITGENISGKVSYDYQTRTLTLDGATITKGIEFQADANWTLVISGNCTVNGNISSTGSSTLTIQSNDPEISDTLTYKPSTDDASGFTSIVYNGMYLSAENARDVKYSPTRQRFDRWDPDEKNMSILLK